MNYFRTVERIENLQRVAASWIGTPFMENAAVKGVGVSCQKLAGAILLECAVFPAEFQIPDAPMRWGGDSRFVEQAADRDFSQYFENILGTSIDGESPQFVIPKTAFGVPIFQPGDILGIGVKNKTCHLALMVTESEFIHVARNINTVALPVADITWAGRIVRAWRPIDVW